MYDEHLFEMAVKGNIAIKPSDMSEAKEFFRWVQESYEFEYLGDYFGNYCGYCDYIMSIDNSFPCMRFEMGNNSNIIDFGYSREKWYLKNKVEVIHLEDLRLKEELPESDMPLDCLI